MNNLTETNFQFVSLLKPNEVAEILSISKQYVYKLIQEQKIASVRIGKSVRVKRQDLDVFIKNSWIAGCEYELLTRSRN